MMVELVESHGNVFDNIETYQRELADAPALQSRLSTVKSWYAVEDDGRWTFGPSKFVGYSGMNSGLYEASADELTGTDTEVRLRHWFEVVDPASELGLKLTQALDAFMAPFGKVPNANVRINILKGKVVRGVKSMPIVDLIVAVVRTLPEDQRKALSARLAA